MAALLQNHLQRHGQRTFAGARLACEPINHIALPETLTS
jgi:hypothetical protein